MKSRTTNFALYAYSRLQSYLQSYSRLFAQHLATPELAIIGSYHGCNVGDMSLGLSILSVANENEINAGLQNSTARFGNWPVCSSSILGGGAIAHKRNLRLLMRNYHPEDVALLGVDVHMNALSTDAISYLQQTPFISCRSIEEAEKLRLRGLGHAVHHPDLAFSFPHLNKEEQHSKTLGINVVCLPQKLDGQTKRKERNTVSVRKNYVSTLRYAISHYLNQGWQIIHVPFTHEDDLFARTSLGDLDISFAGYTGDPSDVLRTVEKCTLFIGTRLHANVFALKCRTPLVSIAYAKKVNRLHDDLDTVGTVIDKSDFAHKPSQCLDKIIQPKPIMLSREKLVAIQMEVKEKIRHAIFSLRR